MTTTLIQTLRSRSFAFCVHVALWVLLYLALTDLGGKAPDFRVAASSSLPPQNAVPVDKLGPLFSPAQWSKTLAGTNSQNPFFTRYFVPPPSPAPPPPPTTRKIEVTYQGFYQTEDNRKQAVLRIGDAFVIAPPGGLVATNLYVAEATMQNLTLTNLAAQTNLLHLNTKKEIEVPIK